MNTYDQSHSISYDAGTFTFNAVSLGGRPWVDYSGSGGTLTIDFKDSSGTIIAERSIYLPNDNSLQTFSENISSVHELYFPATGGFWPRLDSITYNAVPVPGSLLLLGPGLVGLAAMRRRFKK